MNGIVFSRFILILSFVLSVFILFYYRNFDHSAMIKNLSEILKESGEIGVMEYEIFKFHIKSLKTYEKDLILVK